jgi:hypothetical protein
MNKNVFIILVLAFFILTAFEPTGVCDDGITYYVDAANGNDNDNGLSPSNAWKTLSKVNKESFSPGDSILFKRGETWRERLTIPSSGNQGAPITFGAYGGGDKPLILGSVSKNDVNDWINLGDNLWATSDGSFPSDVGFIMFGEEKSDNVGLKCEQQSDIDDDREYWYDQDGGRVVLYCEQKPTDQYSTIELAYSNYLMEHLISAKNYGMNINYVTIENLQLKYFNSHGIQFVNSQGITIRNCNITYGGGEQFEGSEFRVGNGIEFWENAHDCVVEGCKIGEIWDAAVTNQGTDTNEQHNITYKNNIIWNSEYSFELWDHPESSSLQDICFENNVCIGAGFGWGHAQRINPNGWHVAMWGATASADGIYITNNVFYETSKNCFYFCSDYWPYPGVHKDAWANLTNFEFDYNHYYQTSGFMINYSETGYFMSEFSNYQNDTGCDINSITHDKTIVQNAARSKVASEDIPLLNDLFQQADATALDYRTVPSAPQNLQTTGGDSQVMLNWSTPRTDGGSPITNYKIYRGTTSGGETLLATVGNVLTYTDTSVANGQTYYYKVSTVNAIGESDNSSEVYATPTAISSETPGFEFSIACLAALVIIFIIRRKVR